jgi:three-Cys-motif partner protein
LQSYGGPWTLIKLEILEKYLRFYVTAMQKKFKLCYIDAFAGSGDVDVKGTGIVPGSAVRAIDYPFDRYIFIEKNPGYAEQLERAIKSKCQHKNFDIIIGDCNDLLLAVSSVSWYENYWRGIIFLDPYAMELKWVSLEAIAKTKIFDLWYLFPLSALSRVLQKDGKIPTKNREKISELLGTSDWENQIYFESPQLRLFDELNIERHTINGIKKYV